MRSQIYILLKIQVLLVAAILCCKFTFSQTYNFKSYNVENGLPYTQIYAIYQDKEGYLWSGGYGGLSKFDGKTFKNFAPRHGLADYWVTSICEEEDSKLYVGTINGLSIFQNNKFTNLKTTNGLPANHINDLLLLNKDLYVATDSGLCMIRDNKIKRFTEFGKKTISHILEKNNVIYILENGNS